MKLFLQNCIEIQNSHKKGSLKKTNLGKSSRKKTNLEEQENKHILYIYIYSYLK